jgi:hypothetical protein
MVPEPECLGGPPPLRRRTDADQKIQAASAQRPPPLGRFSSSRDEECLENAVRAIAGSPTPESPTEIMSCLSPLRFDVIVSAPLAPFIASYRLAFMRTC